MCRPLFFLPPPLSARLDYLPRHTTYVLPGRRAGIHHISSPQILLIDHECSSNTPCADASQGFFIYPPPPASPHQGMCASQS